MSSQRLQTSFDLGSIRDLGPFIEQALRQYLTLFLGQGGQVYLLGESIKRLGQISQRITLPRVVHTLVGSQTHLVQLTYRRVDTVEDLETTLWRCRILHDILHSLTITRTNSHVWLTGHTSIAGHVAIGRCLEAFVQSTAELKVQRLAVLGLYEGQVQTLLLAKREVLGASTERRKVGSHLLTDGVFFSLRQQLVAVHVRVGSTLRFQSCLVGVLVHELTHEGPALRLLLDERHRVDEIITYRLRDALNHGHDKSMQDVLLKGTTSTLVQRSLDEITAGEEAPHIGLLEVQAV